jgi:hypothetical protein
MTPKQATGGASAVMTQPPPEATSTVMTRGTLDGVPNQEKTPRRTVRVPDDVWLPAKDVAESRGESVSDVVRIALERYVRRNTPRPPR